MGAGRRGRKTRAVNIQTSIEDVECLREAILFASRPASAEDGGRSMGPAAHDTTMTFWRRVRGNGPTGLSRPAVVVDHEGLSLQNLYHDLAQRVSGFFPRLLTVPDRRRTRRVRFADRLRPRPTAAGRERTAPGRGILALRAEWRPAVPPGVLCRLLDRLGRRVAPASLWSGLRLVGRPTDGRVSGGRHVSANNLSFGQ